MTTITEKDIEELRISGKIPIYKHGFPPEIINLYDDELVTLLGSANRSIGNINSYAKLVPNPDLLISPMLLKESLASSVIEGTQATEIDVIMDEAGEDLTPTLRLNTQEVINHREATRLGQKLIKQGEPIFSRTLKQIHHRLLSGVRGANLRRGEFREGSNIVTSEGTIDTAIYIPPRAEEVVGLMDKLDQYINEALPERKEDPLIKAALIHHEFEAIHPFADGNGRLGRTIISLYLLKQGVLEYPLLYVSGYLERNRNDYFNKLLEITTKGKRKEWIHFFLAGIEEQANRSRSILEEIYKLYKEHLAIVRANISAGYVPQLVEYIFKRPGMKAPDVAKELKITHATALQALRKMSELGILQTLPQKRRNIPFYNSQLLDILRKS